MPSRIHTLQDVSRFDAYDRQRANPPRRPTRPEEVTHITLTREEYERLLASANPEVVAAAIRTWGDVFRDGAVVVGRVALQTAIVAVVGTAIGSAANVAIDRVARAAVPMVPVANNPRMGVIPQAPAVPHAQTGVTHSRNGLFSVPPMRPGSDGIGPGLLVPPAPPWPTVPPPPIPHAPNYGQMAQEAAVNGAFAATGSIIGGAIGAFAIPGVGVLPGEFLGAIVGTGVGAVWNAIF